MWTESFFTVYQALDWEFFSDAEGTFSQLSGPVKKKGFFLEKTYLMRDYVVTIHKIGFTQRILQKKVST